VRERERKEEEKLKKKQELAAEWTKREKQDFYRALVTYTHNSLSTLKLFFTISDMDAH
jgi:hypothetical protein